MATEFGFPKSGRLLNSADFRPVFDSPSFKVHHRHFLILLQHTDRDSARLGIVVAKKHVRLAVGRNRIKRAVRESFRQKRSKLNSLDAIVLARRGCDSLNRAELQEILDNLWHRVAKKLSRHGRNAPPGPAV